MLEILGATMGAIFSGGATGLLGMLIQRFFDFKGAALKVEMHRLTLANNIELARMEAESRMHQADRQAHSQIVRAELDYLARSEESSAKVYAASIEADQARYLSAEAQKQSAFARVAFAFVDFLRGITRPALTVFLVAVAAHMYLWARDLAAAHGPQLTARMVQDLLLQIIGTVLYLATTAVVWWFGARAAQPKGRA